ncbi:hypothetical protein DRP07_11650 [Archaeoglobales archaeon]|nr:MAG: hypothetical protein DRP07_11650 [Archaeoglobales archaeon]
MSKGLKLPESLREFLAKPHGKLYRGKGLETIEKIREIRRYSPLVCVGDLVTYYTFKAGYEPDLVVIDLKTVRDLIDSEMVAYMESKLVNYIKKKVKNPPALITPELAELLVESVKELKNRKIYVLVEGEEDLATVLLVYLLPYNSLILYGQPGEGVVALVVDREQKNIIPGVLEKMERLEDGEKIIKLILDEGIL